VGIDIGAGPASLSGEVDFTPTVAIDIALTHGFLGVPDGAQISASATLGVKASLAATLQGTLLKHKIGELDGPPEDYQVGPVPVIVVPKIPIFVTVSGQIRTEVNASITIGAQASWNSHNPGTLSVQNLSTPLTVRGNPLLNASASASIGFSEQPQEDLYDATGPDFEADEDMQATVHPTPGPGEDFFTLAPSLSLKAGWAIDLLSFHATLDATIADQPFPPFVIQNPPGAELSVSPASPSVPVGGSKQFTATRSDGKSFPVTWSVLGGAGDTISGSGLLSTVAPGGRTLIVVATDSTGASGEVTVTVGTAFDPPGNVQAVSSLDGRSATVSWQPPVHTGGAGIKGYQLVTDPPTKTLSVSGGTTTATLTHLVPGVTYLISVFASNSSGLRSSPAAISFTPAVTCSITWTGTSSTAWSTAANWDQNRIPNQNDLVCINNGGTVSLTTAATVYGLTIQGSTLSTTASLTATDLLSLQGGLLQGKGTVTVPPGATLSFDQNPALSGAHLVNQGQASVAAGTTLEIEGATTLENAGTLSLGDGSDIAWDGTASGHLVNDAGATISYPGGPQGAEIDPPLRNNGTVSASAGTLTVTGAVTLTATSSFTGGTIMLDSKVSPSGSGVTLADVTVAGTLAGPGTLTIPPGGSVQMNPGSVISALNLVNKGQLGIGGSFVEVEGATTVENAGTLALADGADLGWDGTSGGRLVNDAGAIIGYPGGSQGAEIDPPVRNSGTVSAPAGTLTLTGAVTITGTGSFTGGGTIMLDSTVSPSGTGASLADVTVAGSLVGPGVLTVPAGGSVQLNPGSRLLGIHLLNKGRLGIGGNSVNLEGASTLENAGTLTLADNADLTWDGTSGDQLINDAGATISYAGGPQGAYIEPPFDNYGTTSASGGTLFIYSGDTTNASDTGTYSAANAAAIQFVGGTRVLGSGITFNGPGQFAVDSGVVSVPGPVSVPNLAVAGGGQLSGPGTVTVPAGGVLTLGSGGSLVGGLTLINQGTGTVQSGSYVSIGGGSTLQNAGTLALADGADIAFPNDSGQLVNEPGATISYAGGTNGASIDVPFDNHGTVSVSVGARGGTLYIDAGNTTNASDTGSYSVSAAGTLAIEGGTRVLGSGFTFTGPGPFAVDGGVVSVPGPVSVSNLAVESGGQLSGPGTVTVPAAGVLTLGSGGSLAGGLTLINQGTGQVQTGSFVSLDGGSVLQNAGTLSLADGSDISFPSDPGQLINGPGATINYPGGNQDASIGVPFDNYGTVSVNVGARGGTLFVDSGNTTNASDTGTYSASSNGTINLAGGNRVLSTTARLTGPGSLQVGGGYVIDSAIGNGASLQLEAGTLEVTPQATGSLASLVENSPATLQYDVSPATPEAGPAQLVIGGEAALGGTFMLQPSPDFVPATGTVLHLLDYASKSGSFSSIVTPAGNVQYAVKAAAKSLTATATTTNRPFGRTRW
jgi:hypothetical protein